MTNQEINRLTFTESPEVKLLGNTFVQVPVILQYDDTPLIEVISGQKAGFTTRFSIYNTDGMDMAKVVGSQIYPTTEGKKAGVTLEYPDKMTVCKLNGRVVFEIRREEAARLKTQAELYTPDGYFIRVNESPHFDLLDNEGSSVQIKGVTVSGNTFIGSGIRIKSDGSFTIG